MSPELQAQVDALVATGLYVRTYQEALQTGKPLAVFVAKGAPARWRPLPCLSPVLPPTSP